MRVGMMEGLAKRKTGSRGKERPLLGPRYIIWAASGTAIRQIYMDARVVFVLSHGLLFIIVSKSTIEGCSHASFPIKNSGVQ